MYFEGRIVPQNYQESAKWFLKASDQGDALGQFNLGHMYKRGYGVPRAQHPLGLVLVQIGLSER